MGVQAALLPVGFVGRFIFCVSLTGPGDAPARQLAKPYFWACLRRCLGKRVAFELVD